MGKKYNKEIFKKYLSPQAIPSEMAQQEILAFMNGEKEFTDLGPSDQFFATFILDQIDNPVPLVDPTVYPEMTTEQYNEFCTNVGIDPDTGRPHTNTQDAIQEEKFEKRFGNIPR